MLLLFVQRCIFIVFALALRSVSASSQSRRSSSWRLEKIKSMYAWEGFVYDINVSWCSHRQLLTIVTLFLQQCPSLQEIEQDFLTMKAKGARNVITFEFCGTGEEAAYYESTWHSVFSCFWFLDFEQRCSGDRSSGTDGHEYHPTCVDAAPERLADLGEYINT